jgi:hypothetical protein
MSEFPFRPLPLAKPQSLVRLAPNRLGLRLRLPNGERALVPLRKSATLRSLFPRPPRLP